MRGGAQSALLVRLGAVYHQDCVLTGALFDLGWYPGFSPGEGRVFGEAYRLPMGFDFSEVDRYEGFDPADPAGSVFVRQAVALETPDAPAWVYIYNGALTSATLVPSGRWL